LDICIAPAQATMSVSQIDAGPALNVPLALGTALSRKAADSIEKLQMGEKLSGLKVNPTVAKIQNMSSYLWALLGFVLIFHGAQFKNLFLCTEVISAFCFTRMQSSVLALWNDFATAKEKMAADDEGQDESKADAKAEAKPENKHVQKRASKGANDATGDAAAVREKDAAGAKKMMKVLDTDKVSAAVFEVVVAAMACHMVMEGGLVRVVVVTNALAKVGKEKISGLLKFSGFEDMQAWTDLLISFVLYAFFGSMALVTPSVGFALNLAVCGAQLITANVPHKIAKGMSTEEFAGSAPGLAMLCGLTAFSTMWQLWAILAGSDMAFYFKVVYLPAYIAENMIGLL